MQIDQARQGKWDPEWEESQWIHVFEENGELPAGFGESREGFRDWQCIRWDLRKIDRKGLRFVCHDLLAGGSLPPSLEWAILRFEILRLFGGVIADDPGYLTPEIEELFVTGCMHVVQMEGGISDTFIASPRGFPFWDFFLRRIRQLAVREPFSETEQRFWVGREALDHMLSIWAFHDFYGTVATRAGLPVGVLVGHADLFILNEAAALPPAADAATAKPEPKVEQVAVFLTPAQCGLPHLDAFLQHNPGVPVHVVSLPPLEGEARSAAWRNADTAMWDWWRKEGSLLDFDYAVFLEWDVLFSAPLETVFPGDAHFYCKELKKPGQAWPWFGEIERLPLALRSSARGSVPLAVMRLSRECLAKMFRDENHDGLYQHDIFCELRLATLATACGFEPVECPGTLPFVRWHPVEPLEGTGVWHAVKQPRIVSPVT